MSISTDSDRKRVVVALAGRRVAAPGAEPFFHSSESYSAERRL